MKKNKQLGFFSEEEIPEKEYKLEQSDEPNCYKCGLYRKVHSPKMKYTGEGKLKCLIIAEANGREEDQKGMQLIGQSGQKIRGELKNLGLDLDRDFWKTNSLACRPFTKTDTGTKNRPPTRAELTYCKPLVNKVIKELNPKFIWLLGGKAIESFWMGEFKTLTATRWRGLCIPDRKTNAYILPMFHPSYIIRNDKDLNLLSTWKRDLKNAVDCLKKKPFEFEDENKEVECLYDFDAVCNLLDDIIETEIDYLTFDYETTGLKPYVQGHKIVSISLDFENISYSFPFDYKDHWSKSEFRQIRKRWHKILKNPNIGKIAHNIKFEDVWTSQTLNVDVKSWVWDTMLASHVLDNRSSYTGLKFQSYINFGVYPYDKEIKKFLKAKTANSFNKVEEAPLDKLLHYGGLDSLLTSKLFYKQIKDFEARGRNLVDAYDLLHDGTLALSKVEQNGICVNEEYYNSLSNKDNTGELDKRINKLEKDLNEGKEAKRFLKETGRKLNKDSNKDLGELLYDILKLPQILTDKGNYSTDKDALLKVKSPFVENLLLYRKLEKVRGTYIKQFMRETYDGTMHPLANLNIPISYRSSVERPSFQNIPKRDEEAKKYTRSGITPSRGNKLLESDFKGIEVSISPCYNKDKNLIEYITDESTDMHRDTAADLWKLKKKEVTKNIRFYTKNQWVFPEFYGDWFGSCAKNLWDICIDFKLESGETLKQHLKRKGIRNYTAFKNHCKKAEDIFWNKRFPEYKQWKKDINRLYRKQGFIETYLGFVFSGYLTNNDCTSYQIQGTAFHCLLWTLIELMKEIEKRKLKTRIIGQIHDSIINDLYPPEEEEIIYLIDDIGTKRIRKEFDWIIVPLKIDHEITEIDGSWYEKEDYKK